MATKLKVSWPEWLSIAGLDVTQVQLSGKIPYHLVNEITKASLREIYSNQDAILGRVSEVGLAFDKDGGTERVRVTHETAEHKMIAQEFNNTFQNFTDRLSLREQDLLQVLIDRLETQSFESLLSLDLVTESTRYSRQEIQNLILQIKDNPEFIEILF